MIFLPQEHRSRSIKTTVTSKQFSESVDMTMRKYVNCYLNPCRMLNGIIIIKSFSIKHTSYSPRQLI